MCWASSIPHFFHGCAMWNAQIQHPGHVCIAHGHGCILCSLPRRSCALHPLQAHVSHDRESSSSTRSSSNTQSLTGATDQLIVCIAVLKSLVMCGPVRDAGAGATLGVWHTRRIRAQCRLLRDTASCAYVVLMWCALGHRASLWHFFVLCE